MCNARSKSIIVKNKITTNVANIWKNNKNTEAQPKISGSYKKCCKSVPMTQYTITYHYISLPFSMVLSRT